MYLVATVLAVAQTRQYVFDIDVGAILNGSIVLSRALHCAVACPRGDHQNSRKLPKAGPTRAAAELVEQ
jgi:hypothetical protein